MRPAIVLVPATFVLALVTVIALIAHLLVYSYLPAPF